VKNIHITVVGIMDVVIAGVEMALVGIAGASHQRCVCSTQNAPNPFSAAALNSLGELTTLPTPKLDEERVPLSHT